MALTDAGRNYMTGAVIANPATLFDVSNAYIGVGDSTDIFDKTETDLQAPTNKARQVVDSAPTNTTPNILVFVATFGTGAANFAWQEWGVFNAAAAGTMLNRKVESLGTKTSAQSWEITATLTVNNP